MEKISGYVEHIIYRNTGNGYSVFELVAEGEEVTCVGTFRALDEGENLELTGGYVEHAVYGSQFKVESYEAVAPEDESSIERYLGSGAIKGIGPSLAARIVKKFGKDTFRIIEQEPERLAEIKGISERKAMEISTLMEEKKGMREAMIYLQKFGISNTLAIKIYNTYGMEVYGVLEENPYRLAEDIEGIGFKRADELAARIGIHTDSDFRIRSGILYTLQLAAMDGHTFLPYQELTAKAAALLGLQEDYVSIQIPNLAMDKKIMVKQDGENKSVYASSFYYAELACARMLQELNVSMVFGGELLPSEEEKMLAEIEKLARRLGIELEELQQQAVLESIKHGIFILSGGPGTGKTTTINTIIRYFEAEGLDILLAAPTGRAAKRMTEATGYEARTIHRLLELNGAMLEEENRYGKNARFEKNEENPLEADVVIVDEMSMVDIHLFQSLLRAVTPGTRLILVGDVNQLPSVGPGQVMQTKNNYQLEWEIVSKYGIPVDHGVGIFNGDMGILKEIDEYGQTVMIEFDEQRRVSYAFAQLEEVELAYAITIHKSQGSEYPAVIMPLLGGPRMLFNRNLLYTGVTRARSCVTILGSRQVVQDMIANESEARRYTSLDVRIKEVMA